MTAEEREGTDVRLLLVGFDPARRAEARDAAASAGARLDMVPDPAAAFARLLDPAELCTHLLVPACLDPLIVDALEGMVDEVTRRPVPILRVGAGADAWAPGDAATMAEAMETLDRPPPEPRHEKLTAATLRRALHTGRLRMRFQPVLEAATLTPVGVEVLARLHHAVLGILRPHEFLPLATESGQERAFASIAAARAMLELRAAGPTEAGILALNVPLSTFCHDIAVEWALEMSAVAAIPPGRVSIELLETPHEPDWRVLTVAVERWRAAGYYVTIDDAGPQLPHWRRMLDLPFGGVKLDGSLAGAAPAAVAEADEIVAAALARGLFVVAEGIEDVPALRRAQARGTHAVQGYLFSRPLPAAALPVWLGEWETKKSVLF